MEKKVNSAQYDGGLAILTDARHCWRKNARFSDVVCIGSRTHTVLCVQTISKNDDMCSQQHELIGVKPIYDYLDAHTWGVRKHAHDNNASVTKYIREAQPGRDSSKDTWYATIRCCSRCQENHQRTSKLIQIGKQGKGNNLIKLLPSKHTPIGL